MARRRGGAIVSLLIIGAAIAAIGRSEKVTPSTNSSAAHQVTASDVPAVPKVERITDAAKTEDQKYGKTCMSLWDGSHPGFVRAVKKRLTDPDSFDHDETKTWPVTPEGRNKIVMTFRSRNGFGGMVSNVAAGSFDNAACDAIEIDLMK